jgi:hypothetical protein
MTTHHRITTAVVVSLGLAMSGTPAFAYTTNLTANGSEVPAGIPALTSQPAHSIAHANAPTTAGSSVDWGYIAIGSSAAALALIGAGAVTTSRRRSHHDKPRRATIAS